MAGVILGSGGVGAATVILHSKPAERLLVLLSIALGNFAVALRLGAGVNKYLLWVGCWMAVQVGKEAISSHSLAAGGALLLFSFAVLCAVGSWRCGAAPRLQTLQHFCEEQFLQRIPLQGGGAALAQRPEAARRLQLACARAERILLGADGRSARIRVDNYCDGHDLNVVISRDVFRQLQLSLGTPRTGVRGRNAATGRAAAPPARTARRTDARGSRGHRKPGRDGKWKSQ